MPKQVIVPDANKDAYQAMKFAPAVRAGDMVYLSGVVATLGETETTDNMTPAIERAFDGIEATLASAGASWADVVDVTSYLTDLDKQLGPMWAVKDARVAAPYPAWTVIGVSRLYGGDAALLEIKVTAYIPQ